MISASAIKKCYRDIQNQLSYMIPEKWNNIYLYSSILTHDNYIETGEMYFYYVPRGILKRNPINVYEIPDKFNINKEDYLLLVDKLYNKIKKLRKLNILNEQKKWSYIIIVIENYKFNIEYYYENIEESEYSSYDRHQIFRYKYLNYPLYSFNKKDRETIRKYILENMKNPPEKSIDTESIYKHSMNNIIVYSNEIYNDEYYKKEERKYVPNKLMETKQNLTNQILKF